MKRLKQNRHFPHFFSVQNAIQCTRRPPPPVPDNVTSTPKIGNPVGCHGSYLRPHTEFDGARRLVRCPNEWASWLCQQDAQKVLIIMSWVADFSLKMALKPASADSLFKRMTKNSQKSTAYHSNCWEILSDSLKNYQVYTYHSNQSLKIKFLSELLSQNGYNQYLSIVEEFESNNLM